MHIFGSTVWACDMRMKKQGVTPASSSNNGLAAITGSIEAFSFEMIPRRTWSTAMNENCYSFLRRDDVRVCVRDDLPCLAYPPDIYPSEPHCGVLGYTTGAY